MLTFDELWELLIAQDESVQIEVKRVLRFVLCNGRVYKE